MMGEASRLSLNAKATLSQLMNSAPAEPKPRKHSWPWFLLAAVILGIVLAVVAVMREAKRIKSMQNEDPLHSKPTTPAQAPHPGP